MLKSKASRWMAGTALVCVLLLVGAWFLLISPKRDEVAAIDEQTLSVTEKNDQLSLQIAQLKQQAAELPKARADLEAIRKQMPPTLDMPALVRTFDAAAKGAGVDLMSITPETSTPLTGASAAGATTGVGSENKAAATAAGATPDKVEGLAAQGTGTSLGSGSVMVTPITVVARGNYFQSVAFLKKLQTEIPQAFLVNSVQVGTASEAGSGSGGSGGTSSGVVDLTIGGQVFTLSDGSATSAATSSGAAGGSGAASSPAGSGGSTPASTPSSTASSPAPTAAALGEFSRMGRNAKGRS